MTQEKTEHPAVTRFREYLRINTVQPKPDYASAIIFLQAQGKSLGLESTVIEEVPGKPILLFTLTGQDPSLPAILLSSHMDVVPVFEDKWSHPPFDAVKLPNGDIVARGSQDMKSVGMGYLEAIRQLIQTDNTKLLRTIYILFTPDEEIGGKDGIQTFVQTTIFKNMKIAVAFDEGYPSENNALTVFYGERSMWNIKLHATGDTGHASQFIPNLAVEKLLSILDKVTIFRKNQETDMIRLDGNLGDTISANITIIHSGIQSNVVPPEASAVIDMRVPPTFKKEYVIELIDSWIKGHSGVSYQIMRTPENPRSSPIDGRFYHHLQSTCREMNIPLQPSIFPSATDSRCLREMGVVAYGISPFRHTPFLLHDHDEMLNEVVFLEGIDFYQRLLMKVANDGDV